METDGWSFVDDVGFFLGIAESGRDVEKIINGFYILVQRADLVNNESRSMIWITVNRLEVRIPVTLAYY